MVAGIIKQSPISRASKLPSNSYSRGFQKALRTFVSAKTLNNEIIHHIMPVYRDNYNDRPTLSTFHYMVLPTWWMDHDKDDQNLSIDLNVISTEMEQVAQYYSDMSWGNMNVTYDILSQFTLNITSIDPRWPQVVHACKTHLSNKSKKYSCFEN